MVWNPAMRRSLSVEHLETKSLPSRSPPITPNWYVLFFFFFFYYPLVNTFSLLKIKTINNQIKMAYSQSLHVQVWLLQKELFS